MMKGNSVRLMHKDGQIRIRKGSVILSKKICTKNVISNQNKFYCYKFVAYKKFVTIKISVL